MACRSATSWPGWRAAVAAATLAIASGAGIGVLQLVRKPVHALGMVAWTRGARLIDDEYGVRQQRSNDCGPAALVHALRQSGMRIEYPDPRGRLRPGPNGCKLEELSMEAARFGGVGRMLRVQPSEIEEVQSPAVLHLRRGHYVVFEGRAETGLLRVHDPALGLLEQTPAELSKTWSGWALEVRVLGGSQAKDR